MKTYIAHDKMTAALKKMDNAGLTVLPITIRCQNIVNAKSDEAKRNLVRAAIYATEERMTRKLNKETE